MRRSYSCRRRICGSVSCRPSAGARSRRTCSRSPSIRRWCASRGFVGRPSAAKKTNREQFLFVNGRYFQSSYFRKAVLQAYDKLIPSDTQPSYFLYITIDPERIDVNVHPQKTEIRFDDEQALWQIFNAAVREALGKTGVVPLMDFEIDPSIDIPVARKGVIYREPDLGVDPSFNPFDEERKTSGAGRPFPAYGRGRESGIG